MKTAAILLAPLAALAIVAIALAAPVAAEPYRTPIPPRVVDARMDETVHIHGIRLRPMRVIEDSRCVKGVRCTWLGRVRLQVRMGGVTREITLGESVQMVGGTMKLAAVLPERTTRGPIDPRAYHFGFMFQSDGRIERIAD